MMLLSITGFIEIGPLDIVDILLSALLLYFLYNLMKGTAAINIFIGIVAIYLIWKLVNALHMELLSEILGAFIGVGFIALIVVFQPEIRRFLLIVGTPSFIKRRQHFLFWNLNLKGADHLDVDVIVKACIELGDTRTGAIIVIARQNELRQFSETGVLMDAKLTEPLLESIFYKNNPIHDGAVIILHNKIHAARCVLPLTKNTNFPEDYGLRHRAAVGITELSDAVAIVVSEQTGEIAFSKETRLFTHVTASQLKNFLDQEFG
jgi:diadenylate cyclase